MLINQSLIKAFVCPRRGRLTVDRGQGAAGEAAGIGRALHTFARLYREHCVARNVAADDAAVGRIAGAAIREHNLGGESAADAMEIVARFASDATVSVYEDYRAEETLYAMPEWSPAENGLGADGFFGTPDLVRFSDDGKTAHVLDYKTNREIPSEEDARADIQLPFYASLVLAHHPAVEVFDLEYRYVRYNWSTAFRLLRDDLIAFRSEIAERVRKIENAGDKPEPGSACQFCSFASNCPVVVFGAVGVIADAASAATVAGKLRAMRRACDDAEKQLRAFCELHGDVEFGDEKVGFVPAERVKFNNLPEVFARLKAAGMSDVESLSAFSTSKTGITTAMKVAGKKDGIDDVLQSGEVEMGTQFRFSKKTKGAK